ncbi:hypothetical protein [Rhodococcus sp. APC 3903]|uniref:hypothetical protein n=1 Tax=Rhodococcus sp. APC 3903 TaxID=3035193 RepID=UPI0025B3B5A3|nr:hypothetical protein [Rhodococcus sp. APC 3903]MDN3457541.1 hypothetical protein [Rhodococcus sp. APC 3903]
MTTHVYSLETVVNAIPDVIAHLRGGLYRQPRLGTGDSNPDSKPTDKPGPRAPANLDALDAADELLRWLAQWAEAAGVDMTNLGQTWRFRCGEDRGYIRGVRNNDPRPADRLRERLLRVMATPGWVPPQGMHTHLMQALARHMKLFPTIGDILFESRVGDPVASLANCG